MIRGRGLRGPNPCFRAPSAADVHRGRYFTIDYTPVGGARTLRTVAAVHPTAGLWNPEWTSHGPFFEKVKDRLAQPAIMAGGGGPFSGGGNGPAGTSFFTAASPLGHPMAPILSYWLDNHLFVASTLIGYTVMQRFPKMKVVVAHGKASWMEEVLRSIEASTGSFPVAAITAVLHDTDELWGRGSGNALLRLRCVDPSRYAHDCRREGWSLWSRAIRHHEHDQSQVADGARTGMRGALGSGI